MQLNELTDVVIGTPTTGQVLKYDGTNWINDTDATGGVGGAFTLDELTDVVIGTPTTGQVLKYDGTNWVNDTDSGGANTLDELTDVNIIGTPTENDVLQYDGTDWVNGPVSIILGDLTNVNVLGTESTGQFLRYSEISSSWENQSAAIDELSDVVITAESLVPGQTLIYDGTSWINDTVTTSLDALSDVIVSDIEISPGVFSLEEGMTLVYDGVNWVNQFATFDSLSDVEIDPLTLTAGQIIKYNGVIWTPADLTLSTLPDVNFGTLNTNDILYWSGTEWNNQRFSISIDDVPQLGGDLDLNSFDITGTGNIAIDGAITFDGADTPYAGEARLSNDGLEIVGLNGFRLTTERGPGFGEFFNISTHHNAIRASAALFTRSKGTSESPTSLVSGDEVFALNYFGHGVDDYGWTGRIVMGSDPAQAIGTDYIPGRASIILADSAGVLRNRFDLDSSGVLGVTGPTLISGSSSGQVDISSVQGYLKMVIGGVERAIPFYAINP